MPATGVLACAEKAGYCMQIGSLTFVLYHLLSVEDIVTILFPFHVSSIVQEILNCAENFYRNLCSTYKTVYSAKPLNIL